MLILTVLSTTKNQVTEYIYCWKNNLKRTTLKGRRCRVIARGSLNSALVEFVDDGQREIISRNALRRVNSRNALRRDPERKEALSC